MMGSRTADGANDVWDVIDRIIDTKQGSAARNFRTEV